MQLPLGFLWPHGIIPHDTPVSWIWLIVFNVVGPRKYVYHMYVMKNIFLYMSIYVYWDDEVWWMILLSDETWRILVRYVMMCRVISCNLSIACGCVYEQQIMKQPDWKTTPARRTAKHTPMMLWFVHLFTVNQKLPNLARNPNHQPMHLRGS